VDVAHDVNWLTGTEEVIADPVVTNAFLVRPAGGYSRPINDAGAGLGMSWLIRDIGRITTDFTIDALRLVIGDRSVATSSRISARFTRPLIRNAGYKAELESLTQSERNLVYDLRSFVQFRKDFCVATARDYYAVLGERDVAKNSFLNFQSSRKNAERSRALAKEGRITQSDLGRLEQQELSAESAWINAVRSYERSLDDFKLALGLSVSNSIVLDDHELAQLRILDPAISIQDSMQVALAARMDYLNAKDALDDSARKVKVAESFLKPQLDFSAGAGFVSDPDSDRLVTLPDTSRYSWDAGLAFDPGLDRKAERNAYLQAVIARNKAVRNVEQSEDTVRLEVRNSWRTLDQAKRNYEIAEVGVRLSERRVEEQNILAELGRAKAQDQVDAQNALNDSKNAQTRAIVAHTLSRLEFWNRLGILFIKENGQWEQTKDVETASIR
jgi:outer membrane protein TolC